MPDAPDQYQTQPIPPPPSTAPTAQPAGFPYNPYAAHFGSAGPYATPYGAAPYGGYPPRKPRSAWFWPVIILGVLLVVGLFAWLVIWAALHSSDDTSTSNTFSSSRIAVIDLSGVIIDADKIDTELKKFGDDTRSRRLFCISIRRAAARRPRRRSTRRYCGFGERNIRR